MDNKTADEKSFQSIYSRLDDESSLLAMWVLEVLKKVQYEREQCLQKGA